MKSSLFFQNRLRAWIPLLHFQGIHTTSGGCCSSNRAPMMQNVYHHRYYVEKASENERFAESDERSVMILFKFHCLFVKDIKDYRVHWMKSDTPASPEE